MMKIKITRTMGQRKTNTSNLTTMMSRLRKRRKLRSRTKNLLPLWKPEVITHG